MKPTGRKTKEEFRVFLNDKGDVVGMAHEVESVEVDRAGRKPIEVTLNQEAISGRKTKNSLELPNEIKDRIMDHKDPLQLRDLDAKNGQINLRRKNPD